ncbi:unnamed protein product [Orchesella dallaii]|uniref:Uncharacterized protein n=1 Tax=Orchesella dallaii TaxID=48710 RepID=A0ABP1RGU5_9HEXA
MKSAIFILLLITFNIDADSNLTQIIWGISNVTRTPEACKFSCSATPLFGVICYGLGIFIGGCVDNNYEIRCCPNLASTCECQCCLKTSEECDETQCCIPAPCHGENTCPWWNFQT